MLPFNVLRMRDPLASIIAADLGRPYFVSVGTPGIGTGNVTPGMPPGWKPGHILTLMIRSSNQPGSAPAGWNTPASGTPQQTGTAAAAGAIGLELYWRRAEVGDVAPTVTDRGDHTHVLMAAYADCVETGDPFDAIAGSVVAVADANISCPSVTASVDRALICNIVATSRDSTTSGVSNGNPTNANLLQPLNRFNDGETSGTGGSITLYDGLLPLAGSSGNTTHTCFAAFTQALITFALKPRVSNLPYVALVGDRGGGTLFLPSGILADDIIVICCETDNAPVTTLAGYTAFSASPQGTGTPATIGATRLTSFWKRSSGSDSGAVSITATGDDHLITHSFVIRGCRTSGDPYEAIAGDVEASANATVTWPDITTLGDDRLIVLLLAHDRDELSPPDLLSGLTNSNLRIFSITFDDSISTNTGGALAVAIGAMDSAGAIGNTTGTLIAALTQGRMALAFPSA